MSTAYDDLSFLTSQHSVQSNDMEVSRYFERTLFYDRSPAADEYYERSAEFIFETDPANCRVEVFVHSNRDLTCYGEDDEVDTESKKREAETAKSSKRTNYKNSVTPIQAEPSVFPGHTELPRDHDDAWSVSSKASSTALPTALDQRRGNSLPPTYPGPPRLSVVNLNIDKVQTFIRDTKEDFRVFYLRQRHSNSRIQATKELFERLLNSCHVFPRFNEYLIGFGAKNSETEVGPPPLKFRPLCELQDNSYHGFECSYILRYVEFTNRAGKSHPKKPWSLRQFAVYHRYKPNPRNRCSTWILAGASQRTELRLDRYTRSIDNLAAVNPFELHVIFLDTAIASWRPYLVYLTQQVTHQSNKAVGLDIGDVDGEGDFISIEVEDHQELKLIEDQIADLILCLDSTLDTVSTFLDMYERIHVIQGKLSQSDTSSHLSAYGSDAVVFALKEKEKEVTYTRKKAEALLSKVQNTRTLISSLLERQSGHSIKQQILALHSLERQAQDETSAMRQLAEKNARDSSSMRILTIITMIYLPCTIVSNFYSTQFVDRRDLESGGSKLEYAQNAWLFFAISGPLTAFTIFIWYLWVNLEQFVRVFRKYTGDGKRPGRRTKLFSLGKPATKHPC